MNFQSVKLRALTRAKSIARTHKHAKPREIGKNVNLQWVDFSELKIEGANAFAIENLGLHSFALSCVKPGNWSRSEFPALKIETVENGSIRQ